MLETILCERSQSEDENKVEINAKFATRTQNETKSLVYDMITHFDFSHLLVIPSNWSIATLCIYLPIFIISNLIVAAKPVAIIIKGNVPAALLLVDYFERNFASLLFSSVPLFY